MTQPQQHPTDTLPGDGYLGKYRLVATLGRGGMGTVYLALASGFGAFRKLLVVKELRNDVAWKSESLAMFMDEAQLAARLEHPNVLQTFEAGESQGRYFLAMEYLDGQPLNVLIERTLQPGKTQLKLELQLHILREMLKGLQYAHELRDYDGSPLNVVHRDVSPHNVFVTYHGQVKIVDFGLAKADTAGNLTNPGIFKGKFAYAAPEQLTGKPIDGRCDVFSVGVMLWEAIAMRRFGDGTPTPASLRLRTTGSEPRIREVVPDVDPRLAEISDRALAIDPEQRYQSAAELQAALDDYLLAKEERIESEQLADVMRGLFAEERSQRHRVIERAMTDVGATRSTIQALPIQPSTVGALPRPSHVPPPPARARISTASVSGSRPMSLPGRPRRKGIARSWWLAALAVWVFGATYYLSRSFTSAPLPSLQESPAPAPALQPTAAVPEAEPAPAPTVSADSKPTQPTAAETPDEDFTQQPAHGANKPGRVRQRSNRRARDNGRVGESQGSYGAANPRSKSEPAIMGTNLRDLRQSPSKTRIDLEDPYQ